MRWNAPLSQAHADLLLERLEIQPGARLLDLGCGWGEFLLQAVAGGEGLTRGVGVDTDARALERGQRCAVEYGLAEHVQFVQAEAAGWSEPADRVICIGASHAWASAEQAFVSLRQLVMPTGRLLFGEGGWQQPPTEAAIQLLGREVLPLQELTDAAVAAGWQVLSSTTSDQREWDDFEETWRAGRLDWLAAHPAHPQSGEVRQLLDERQLEYETVYRGLLGFGYLVLAPT